MINRLLALEQTRLDDQRAFQERQLQVEERLLQLLEAREAPPRSEDSDVGNGQPPLAAAQRHRSHGPLTVQRVPAKLALRMELQQLQALEPPKSDLDELLRIADMRNTLTTDKDGCIEYGFAIEKAADDPSNAGLLSKGQELLELSTRIDAATILALSEDTNVKEVGPTVSKLMASLLNAAAKSANSDRLSHRLVCILTSASRLVIVLHIAVAQGYSNVLTKDAVEQWKGALSKIRKLSREWTNHMHVQNLIGLQLTMVESGLMSIPDPSAKGRAVISGLKLASASQKA